MKIYTTAAPQPTEVPFVQIEVDGYTVEITVSNGVMRVQGVSTPLVVRPVMANILTITPEDR